MFRIDRSFWGNREVLKLSDSSGNGFVFAPEQGACLIDLSFKGRSILHSYNNQDELESLSWMRSALLFPFPNRLKDGMYTWDKQTFYFPVNEPGNNNALHGFGFNAPFKCKSINLGVGEAGINLVYNHQPRASFPFRFLAEVSYLIRDNGSFEIQFEVKNLHFETLPFAWGWHPYFRLDENGADNWKLMLPKAQLIETDDRQLPTGKRSNYNVFESPTNLRSCDLDHCFFFDKDWEAVKLICRTGQIEISSLSNLERIPFFQVFIPPDRNSVALEPMSANIDAFNNLEGLWKIRPTQSKKCGAKITFRSF